MHKAFVGTVSRSVVSGWALDTSRPNVPITVSILVDGQHVADASADVARADLARLDGFGDGRHGFRFNFVPPLGADRPHRVSLHFADTGTALPGGEHVLTPDRPPPERAAPALTPILVTGPGRTGTTLLMSLLARSPDIVAAELVPYETRQLAYHAHAHHVLTHAADTVHSTHQDRLQGDGYHIGFNPYHSAAHASAFRRPALAHDFADHYAPPRMDALFADLVAEYYRRLAQDYGKPDARFFAEKNNNLQRLVRLFARRAFGRVREIVTIRDPRDVFCSYLAYFKVDAEHAFSDLSHATRIIAALAAEMPDDVFFCRYERLLRADTVFLSELSTFLGTPLAPRSQEERAAMFARHATSATPFGSIERWRTDLPAGWLDRCNTAWRPFLDAFGYPLA